MSRKTKPRIYISGPITGMPGLNKHAFQAAARSLLGADFLVVNPIENGVPDTAPWQEHMRVDIAMLTGCDGVATLPGHIASKGARLEVHIARQLGMPVMTVAQWLEKALAVQTEAETQATPEVTKAEKPKDYKPANPTILAQQAPWTTGPWHTGPAPHGHCRIYAPSETHAIARTYGPELNGIGVCELTGPSHFFDAQLIARAPEMADVICLLALAKMQEANGEKVQADFSRLAATARAMRIFDFLIELDEVAA